MKNENEKMLSFRIDAKTFLEYKRLCVEEDKSIKEYTTDLILKELDRKRKGNNS